MLYKIFVTMIDLKETQKISAEIRAIKKSKNAIILAHYYQESEIQELADMVGDSLQMAHYAAASRPKF